MMPDEINERLHEFEKKFIRMQGDIEHIKGRIDNGVSTTIQSIWKEIKVLTELKTKVDDNSYWVGVIKRTVVWISVGTLVGGGGITAIIIALAKYAK